VIRFRRAYGVVVSKESKSNTGIAATSSPGWAQRLALFGPPLLIAGEDAAAYDQLLARICAAVRPVDIIDEMFIADVVSFGVGGLAVAPLEMEFPPSACT
jgi:hypothetical protein